MANLGRVYERLFERDQNWRRLNTLLYLPRYYGTNMSIGLGSACIRYQNGRFKSAEGVCDYNTGITSWTWTPPSPVTPGAFKRLEHHLTFDENWYFWRLYNGVSGVDWYYTESLPATTAYPTAAGFQLPGTWVITPQPCAAFDISAATVWKWADVEG